MGQYIQNGKTSRVAVQARQGLRNFPTWAEKFMYNSGINFLLSGSFEEARDKFIEIF